MSKLKQSTIEKLGYYVYLLKDPSSETVFYVGKGKGNRINSHSLRALVEGEKKSEKIKRILSILESGSQPELIVLRHGLSEKEAFEVEAAAIDIYGNSITNIVAGHNSDERGMMSVLDLELKYQAKKAIFNHKAMLITINQYNSESTTAEALYEKTRSAWIAAISRAEKVEVVCSVYRGIIREVYVPQSWHFHPERENRIFFEGKVAGEVIRNQYLHRSVKHLIKYGSANPVRYINAE